MSINATLLGQMIVFALLVWFTMKFVWPMILGAMEERNEKIAAGLAAADQGERSLEAARDEADEIIRHARGNAVEIVDQANHRANDILEQARREAQSERERQIEAARSEIDQERNRARDELRGQVSAIAIAGAEKILTREIDRETHRALLDELVAQL